ncbi:MAG: magnesium transporter [Lentisphaerae bacterium]|nr:magnesium transporter [Lentisphaerota bacterium]
MKNPLLVPELLELLEDGRFDDIRLFCQSAHPGVVAEMLSALPEDKPWEILQQLPQPLRSEIFSHLDDEIQSEMVENLNRGSVAALLTHMPPDDRADFVKRLPEERRETILPALAQVEREDIRRLSAYEEGTVGAVMTSDYATLSAGLTAFAAIEQLRQVAPDKETIYYAYVIDEQRRMVGFVSLKDLILARRDALVGGIMHQEVIRAHVGDDQEDAARKIQKYGLIALPVVNDADALVGILTHDDALDIITQEQTEDMEKIMAIAGSHQAGAYLRTSLVILAAFGLVSGFIVQSFEGLLMQFAILAVFMPMLADTGGNTGSQSATLVVRALALKEVLPRDFLRILGKELRVALMLGLLLGVLAYARVMFFGQGSVIPDGFSLRMIGLAVALALGLQVVTATIIGSALPMAAARLKFDPAVVASPALTTIVDITGLTIYFATVKFMLGL